MSRLTESLRNVFKVEDLRKRILYTAGILAIVRLGAHITLPGVDASLLADVMRTQSQNTLFGLYDLFAGGAFSNAAIFALGIMPYISAEIVIQLLGAVVPYFQKLQREGEEGQKKIRQLSRYGTVLISALQAWGVSVRLESMTTPGGLPVIPDVVRGLGFTLSTIIFLTSGTIFMMWLGEQITDKGIGNGISLIITINIIARFPNAILDEYQLVSSGTRSFISEIVVVALMIGIVAAIVFVTEGTRKVPVQYAKRVVGRKVYGGVT